MATTRKTFDENDDASIADAIPHRSTRPSYGCMAHDCPMAGAIFTGGDGGICAYHHGTHGTDWPRITRALQDWHCLTAEINDCRRAHRNPLTAMDGKVLDHLFAKAWQRLQPLVGEDWGAELRPSKYPNGFAESYRDWGVRLERFLAKRVTEAIRTRKTERLDLGEVVA